MSPRPAERPTRVVGTGIWESAFPLVQLFEACVVAVVGEEVAVPGSLHLALPPAIQGQRHRSRAVPPKTAPGHLGSAQHSEQGRFAPDLLRFSFTHTEKCNQGLRGSDVTRPAPQRPRRWPSPSLSGSEPRG